MKSEIAALTAPTTPAVGRCGPTPIRIKAAIADNVSIGAIRGVRIRPHHDGVLSSGSNVERCIEGRTEITAHAGGESGKCSDGQVRTGG